MNDSTILQIRILMLIELLDSNKFTDNIKDDIKRELIRLLIKKRELYGADV